MSANIIYKTFFKCNLQKLIANSIYTSIRNSCHIPAIVMNNGNEMPIVGFGTWSSSTEYKVLEKEKGGAKGKPPKENPEKTKAISEQVAKAVGIAIDAGYRHIDCAHLYKNEKEIGEVLAKKIQNKIVTREQLFITSKLWNTNHDPENVCPACVKTLKNLGLEYLDLYLMHTPMGFQHGDNLFPMCDGKVAFSDVDYIETWQAMEELIDNKLCKNIGISNFNMEQIRRLIDNCQIIPQNIQIELHPYLTQKDLLKCIKYNGISVTSYASVGSPKRPWAKDQNVRELLSDHKIVQLAEKHKRTPGQILLRYQIQLGHAVIPKSTNREHIAENINVFDFELCPEDMDNIESLNHNLRYFKFSGAYGHPYHPFEMEENEC